MSILHTVMPLPVVLAGWRAQPDPTGLQMGDAPDLPPPPARRLLDLGGCRYLEVEVGPDGYVVRRLFSPLPQDYLNPRYQPGRGYQGP